MRRFRSATGLLRRVTHASRAVPVAYSAARCASSENQMNVGQLCSRPGVTAPASSTLMDVAALMRDSNIGAVIITKSPLDRPVPVGVITDRDIVQAQLDRTADLSAIS